jgi:biopolymer transport protein ExbD
MSVMQFKAAQRKESITLNMTPLIDVLFLFIIFFMLTGTFKRVGELELRLPDSSTASPAEGGEESRNVDLVVAEDGRLLLGGDSVEMPELKQRLLALLGEDPQTRILIKAEASVAHGEVVRLLDIIREAGFAGVGIGTHIKPLPPPAEP